MDLQPAPLARTGAAPLILPEASPHPVEADSHSGHDRVGRMVSAAWLGPLVLLAVTLLLFGDVLFSSKGIVLSRFGTDLSSHFVYSRAFGFGELRRGNLALWNPHIFSGAPYLGSFSRACSTR